MRRLLSRAYQCTRIFRCKIMFRSMSYTLLTVLTVDLLATSGDITMTWTSPMLPKLYSNDSDVNPLRRPITKYEDSWISSLTSVGAMFGPFPYGIIAEQFGRKIGILCIALPHIVSYLILAFSDTVGCYYVARFLGGIALGGGYTLLPMYIAEIAEDSNRGMLSVTLNVFWTLGNLIPYLIGPYISALWFNLIIACVPTAFFVLFFVVAPESPFYLVAKDNIQSAERSLMILRSHKTKVVAKEIKQMQCETSTNDDKIACWDFFTSKIYMKGLFISLVLIITQQLSGINAVLFYTEEIFEEVGASSLAPEISSMIIGLVVFFSSFGTPFVVDSWGRKPLMLLSVIGVTLSHLTFGIYFYLRSINVDVSSVSWLPLISLVSYIIMYNNGLGPIPWTISSELFPTNVKCYSATLVSCACWTTSFFVTKFFNNLIDGIGEGETFWLFGSFSFVAGIFTWLCVPETKGKSFQEIQEVLDYT